MNEKIYNKYNEKGFDELAKEDERKQILIQRKKFEEEIENDRRERKKTLQRNIITNDCLRQQMANRNEVATKERMSNMRYGEQLSQSVI